MRVDLVGKIKNTQLPRSKSLLPMFEAVVNSFQAIEDSGAGVNSPQIEIIVHRDAMLPGMEVDGDVDSFTVTDNGIGFTDENLHSFFTSDTQYKIARGGKGIGRFIWLKAFECAQIESHYYQNGQLLKRVFTFTTEDNEAESEIALSAEPAAKTIVHLKKMRSPYKDNCPHGIEIIGRRLMEHCLPFFLDPQCPLVIIRDEKESINLSRCFRETFVAGASDHAFKIVDETFRLKGLRLYHPHDTQHRLIYAANSREVLQDKLERYLPNLKRRLSDHNGPFAYLGFIESTFLDTNVNGERTNFTFPIDQDHESSLGEISLETVREAALSYVTKDLQPYIDEINTEKRATIRAYITQEAPQYRSLARYLSDFIDRIPPGTTGQALDALLHEQQYERERQLKQESHTLIHETENASLNPEEYEAKLNDFLDRENELGKSSLAQYVAHRKIILEFLEKSIQAKPDTKKYPLESIIHRLIYPMRTTSDEVPYEQQNLWIIDERLSYHWFLTSDMPLSTPTPLINSSESRPDLMIFERALTFAEDDAPITSLVVIEFKQPERQSYKEDPVDQVYRIIRDIRSGHFKDKNGNEIKLQNEAVPAYAYIICDVTKSIEIIAENKAMMRTPDNLGFYVYNQNLSAYVEIISYKKLLRDAKRRNKFFLTNSIFHLVDISAEVLG